MPRADDLSKATSATNVNCAKTARIPKSVFFLFYGGEIGDARDIELEYAVCVAHMYVVYILMRRLRLPQPLEPQKHVTHIPPNRACARKRVRIHEKKTTKTAHSAQHIQYTNSSHVALSQTLDIPFHRRAIARAFEGL